MHAAITAGRTGHIPDAQIAPRDFPPIIQRALARLSGRVGALADLGASLRGLLAEFVRCASAKSPAHPIRVRNESLALALDCSERTVARLKAELEQLGWIRRHQDITRRHGAQVADVWLTEQALQALGLAVQDGDLPTQERQRQPPAAHAYGDSFQSPSERQPAGSVEQPKGPNPVLKAMPGRVPEDLRFLLQLGVTPAGVFRLMSLARQAGTRLSQVVCVALEGIKKSRDAYSYVRRLLALDRDWTEVASRRADELRLAAQRAGQGTGHMPIDPALLERRASVQALVSAMGDALWRHAALPLQFRVFAGVVHEAPNATEAWRPLLLDQAAKLTKAWQEGRLAALAAS